MIFDIFMSIAIFYLCYKLVMFRRRKTREFKEKKREERK
jgi:cbb3-type cytochrome oxidase subunit 3